MTLADSQLNEIHYSLVEKIRSGTVTLDDIGQSAERIREALDLDMIFAVTNVGYRYQLDHIITCTREGIELGAAKHIQLSEERLRAVTDAYLAKPISDTPIPELDSINMEAQLHAAITHRGEYFGTVGFARVGAHEWTSEEKHALDFLALAVLVYLGLSRLLTGVARDARINEIAQREDLLSCYHIDFPTDQCHAVKLAPFLNGLVSEWMPYGQLVMFYADKFIDPVYGERMKESLSAAQLMKTLTTDNPVVSLEMPRILDGCATWINCTVEALDFEADGTPIHAAISIRDATEDARKNALLARGLRMDRNDYAAITGINLDTERYAVYVDNRADHFEQEKLEGYGEFCTIMGHMASDLVDPAYADRFRELFDIDRMREDFDGGSHIISLDFPCYFGHEHYWVRLEAIPATTYEAGNRRVVLYYSDITEEKHREFQLEEARRSLEAERRRVTERELQLTIDPLTGAYNRVGYENYVASLAGGTESLAFLMIDVDHFKELNDNYGHETGDQALAAVVKMLKLTFRNEDKVFRMGGDEFVMVLEGCKETAWESICKKISSIHGNLRRDSHRTDGVTLSVGMVISPQGYLDKLPTLADDALYITKRNGRAGVTQVDLDGAVVESWNDSSAATLERDRRIDIGKWRYECSKDGSQLPRLFLDEPARFLLGVPDSLTPEECYCKWVAALPEQHAKMLKNMQDKTAAVGQAEATHSWRHPQLGEIRVRTRVKYRETRDYKEFTGHFVVFNDDAMLSPDDSQFVIQAMSNACFSTYYIDLASREYTVMRGFDSIIQPVERGIEARLAKFIERDVHPDFAQRALAFVNLDTLSDRLAGESFVDFEYLSLTEYGWCRSRFLPVKWDVAGRVTHVLLSSISIDSQKRQELEQAKHMEDTLRLQLRVGEMVAKSTLLQTGIVHKRTGKMSVWTDGLFSNDPVELDFSAARQWGIEAVAEADKLRFERDFALEHIVETVERDGKCTMSFRMSEEAGDGRTIMHHYETLQSDPHKMLMAVEEVTELLPKGVGWMTQFELLESLGESISIFDYETRDIVYLNKAARDYAGIAPQQLAGMKCFDLYNEGKGRCSFCEKLNCETSEDSFYLKWLGNAEDSLFIHVCATEINGAKYLVEETVPLKAIKDGLERIDGIRGE